MTLATGRQGRALRGVTGVGRSARAFTLLEIIAVLLVISVLAGTAAGLVFQGDGFHLARAQDDVTALVRRAARFCAADGSDYTIRFKPGECALLGADGEVIGDTIFFPQGSRLGLRGFRQTKFVSPDRTGVFWVMQASGLCRPLTVRLEMGREEWEVDFGPLGGGVVATRSTSYR